MQATCPCCQTAFPLEAGMLDADAKRLAMVLAGADPALGRALIGYLRLHKPAKTVLRMGKAAKLAEEVVALATASEVRRGGVSRPNAARYWAMAIEQMLELREKLRLPLSGHGYLTEVAYSLADSADAAFERQAHADARAGKHLAQESVKPDQTPSKPAETKLQNALAYITQQLHIGSITAEQATEQRAAARAKHGVKHA